MILAQSRHRRIYEREEKRKEGQNKGMKEARKKGMEEQGKEGERPTQE